MHSIDKIISIFCLIDDILKGIDHDEDIRRRVSDSEIILTAIKFMKLYGYIPQLLDKSKFNRQLNKKGV
jgi:hypothetical protein